MAEENFGFKSELLQYTEENLKTILAKYDRDLTNINIDIETIKEWFKTQPHLQETPCNRQILHFLVMNKFSIERTKEKLEMNYSIRSIIPEYYNNLLPNAKEIIEIKETVQMVYLPKLTKDLNRVLVVVIKDTNLDKFHGGHFYRLYLLFCELRTIYDLSSSDEYILDFSKATAGVLAKLTPTHIKTIITILEKVYPNRLSAFHFVNLPSYADKFLALVKSFLKPKISQRVHTHANFEDLWRFYDKEILPSDFGGTERSVNELKGEWDEFLEENTQHFQKLQELKVDLSLRPDKLKNDEILGFHGNFRQLQVD